MSWPSPDVFLTSERLLVKFDKAVLEDPDVGLAAQVITVELYDPFPLDSLRRSLVASTLITDLIIFLPLNTTPVILDNLLFPQLGLFKTNLPHHTLVGFLSVHPSLRDLCLDACGRVADDTCPLGRIDLCHVTTVECPVGCVHEVAHPNLFRLTAEAQHPVKVESPTVFASLSVPFACLFSLTLDIFPDHYDILRSVVISAPRVRILKLLERPRTMDARPQGRRAWTKMTSWGAQLMRLKNLSELALQTSATVARSRTLRSEEATFSKWVLWGSRADPHAHPTLTSLRVWYRCREADGGVLTCWSRSTGVWVNIARVVGPERGAPF